MLSNKLSNFYKMKKTSYSLISRIVFLAGLLTFSGCDKQAEPENGFLKGTISIGPLCPVEKDPPDPACLPTAETYKAYPVYVCTPDDSKKIALISPSLDGSFETELAPGKYLVILDKVQINIGSSNLPQEVTINSFETTVISIEIDTGIR
jgi:hypothetical protein